MDCIVDVIPLSVAVKILDASLFDLQIGHTPVLPYEPLHGLLALRRTLVVLAQKELRPSQSVRADSFAVEMAKLTVLCSISSCISITSSAESRV